LHPAFGDILGGGPRSNGLTKGFAVISSDAGHAMEKVPGIGGGLFGVDPQARLDYGYNAVAQLTPMAKSVIAAYYGKRPDKSYIVGTSNGGRHGMVAAARDSGEYDGVLATAPGYRLPYAALTQIADAQQFAKVAAQDPKTGRPDLNTSFPPAALNLIANKVLERCDALDGLKDGIVSDLMGCQKAFNLARDVPTCAAKPNGQCLTAEQKKVMAEVFAGPKWKNGQPVYSAKAWDPGLAGKDWGTWKFKNSVGPRDPLSVGFAFSTPPVSPKEMDGKGTSIIDYVMKYDLDKDGQKIFAKNATYTQSSIEFMLPPEAEKMSNFVARGGKLLVAHGSSDPVFSVLDTIDWYEKFSAFHGQAARNSARFFIVPGMNHSRNGPATDQYDMVDALVAWVEQGKAPDAIVATARGKGSNLPNPEVPASWSPNRTRLLCAYPQIARYNGKGDSEVAASFKCVNP
ncbi:feruloyl esterase, partial [Formivibrio citricus]